SAVTTSGEPTATTRTSASSVSCARSRVREWQIVTVAFACSSRCAIGLPTMSLRPTTTACAPSSGTRCSASSAMIPSGVAGTSVGPSMRVAMALDRELYYGYVEAQRLGEANADLEVLLQPLEVALVHRAPDERTLLRTPERMLDEDRQQPVRRVHEPLLRLLV